jgi:hypothetical protein
MRPIIGAIGVAILVMALLASCVVIGANIMWLNFEYNSKIHAHFENAYYSADPTTMEKELLLAKQGMLDSGLTPDMYDAFWPWQKTPDRKMEWQYAHIDSVLSRVGEFKRWEESQTSLTSSQQMKDVYTEKLDNVRHFIKDDGGWSDWIAHGAFTLNLFFWLVVLSWIAVAGWIVGGILLCVGLFTESEYSNRKKPSHPHHVPFDDDE